VRRSEPAARAAAGAGDHGLRERQVRGSAERAGRPETRVAPAGGYRCRRCGGLTVLPRGLTAPTRRRQSAWPSAFTGHGACRSAKRGGVCARGLRASRPRAWPTLSLWTAAVGVGRLFPRVRPAPPGGIAPHEGSARHGNAVCRRVMWQWTRGTGVRERRARCMRRWAERTVRSRAPRSCVVSLRAGFWASPRARCMTQH